VKATIYKKVSREKLARVLPENLAELLPRIIPEPATAIVFRDKVVSSRIARKAIEHIGTDFGSSLVFAAHDFAPDATELASAHGVVVIAANG